MTYDRGDRGFRGMSGGKWQTCVIEDRSVMSTERSVWYGVVSNVPLIGDTAPDINKTKRADVRLV